MDYRTATIARYTLLEALRTRLPALLLTAVLAVLAMSWFAESLSVTEGARFQAGFYAAGMRLACVFIAGLTVLVSVALVARLVTLRAPVPSLSTVTLL